MALSRACLLAALVPYPESRVRSGFVCATCALDRSVRDSGSLGHDSTIPECRSHPLLDDRELTVPRITRINRPFQMAASSSDNITVAVDTVKKEGSSAEDGILSFRFRSVDNDSLPLDNITGGSFSPASGDVTKSGSSYPDISTTYTAPDNDSTMKLQVRVSNELEIGVTSRFNVYVTDDIETQNTVDTNPVIENISAERLDNGDLKWTMNVSNDDGFSGLKVKW